MRFFAILTMLIAWLFYGAMPALASCPICDSVMAMPAASAMSIHGDMPGMAGHGDMAQHEDRKPENPCAGGMAHVPSCAACLAVTPVLAAADSRQDAFSYPVPAPGQRLAGSRPEPTAPPPRFA
ncbi:hypothetical protein [Rhizobium lusitanum]|uniref:DUF2946 domain-containing protein n=1 Tax=Rhizobium lusitanum TaxID=293958 RepID=A0A1C3U635_9HYPH|nr:hypothetical protein [Rhizobium lusitanum]SCB10951.1 hypothetical protein GA0061101_101576 [Rhizobium lusitanum]